MIPRVRAGNAWIAAAARAAVVLGISWLYGLMTGTFSFGAISLWQGWSKCVDAGLPCGYVGHPIGVNASVASGVIYGTWGLNHLGLDTASAMNVLAVVAIAAGVLSLWSLGRHFGGGHLGGAVAAILYFSAPLVLQHAGLFQLFLGFAVLPVPLALVVTLFADEDRAVAWWRGPLLLLAVLATGTTLVYLDPYPWVVATAIAASVALAQVVRAGLGRQWAMAALAAAALIVLAVPGAVFRSAQSSDGLETKMVADFYRGMGVDTAVALVPTKDSTLGSVTGIGADPWSALDFTGDGSQLSSSYLGIPLLGLALVGLVHCARRRGPLDIAVVIGVLLGGIASLILSLGPSLKVLDRDPTPRGDTITFADYLMPASDATLELPWNEIYEHQPLASMRATYRWQAGGRLVLTLLAAVGVAAIARRQRALAVGVGLLVLLDTAPDRLWDQRARSDLQAAEFAAFEHDMEVEFGGGRLVPGERVLFLPAENDYLVQYIAPTFRVRSYNLSFDKAIAQIRPKQPPEILEAIALWDQQQLKGPALCSLFADDLVDAVVLDHFSLRWDSYRWPPPDDAVRQRAEGVSTSPLLDEPGLEFESGTLSVITRARTGGPCSPSG